MLLFNVAVNGKQHYQAILSVAACRKYIQYCPCKNTTSGEMFSAMHMFSG